MKNKFVSALLIALSLYLATPGFSIAASDSPIDKIVATVNDGIIMQSELNTAISHTKQQMAQANATVPNATTLRQQVLDQLIYQKLQLQIADRMHLKVTEAQIDQAIDNIKKQNNITMDQLISKLKEDNISYPDFRKEIGKQILFMQLQRQAVGNQVNVTPAEVDAAYAKVKQQAAAAKQYNIMDIVLPSDSNATSAQANALKASAVELIQNLQAGKTTIDLLKSNSDVSLNDMGWKSVNDLPSIFVPFVQNAVKGDLKGPILAPNGYHVLKIVDTRQMQVAMPSRQQVQMMVYQQKFQKAVLPWLQQLRKSAYVKIMD